MAERGKRTVKTHSFSFPNHNHDCYRDGQNWAVVENCGGDTVCISDIGAEAIVLVQEVSGMLISILVVTA